MFAKASSLELMFGYFRRQIQILHVQICIYVTGLRFHGPPPQWYGPRSAAPLPPGILENTMIINENQWDSLKNQWKIDEFEEKSMKINRNQRKPLKMNEDSMNTPWSATGIHEHIMKNNQNTWKFSWRCIDHTLHPNEIQKKPKNLKVIAKEHIYVGKPSRS